MHEKLDQPGALHTHATVIPDSNPRPQVKLWTDRDFRAALGGVCERTFAYLRARGVVDPPLELAPRLHRWTAEDVANTIARLPRAKPAAEPKSLAAGRRERIERMKAGPAAPAASAG